MFVVVYGLVRKAPSLSSPVDIASLAWPFRDEQSSYDGIGVKEYHLDVATAKESDGIRASVSVLIST